MPDKATPGKDLSRRNQPVAESGPRLPAAPRAIQKGSTLKDLLDRDAIECLAHNISRVHSGFDGEAFRRTALEGLKPLGLLARGQHLARALHAHLPERFDAAVEVLILEKAVG
jgi:hypothetical protein